MGWRKLFLIFAGATALLYLPVLANPQLLLSRGNDLQEYYWPIIYYVKHQILDNHTFPLWNTMFFSGTPLVSDPQSPQFYLPNTLFLVLPIDLAFLLSFVLHSLFAGLGAYLAARFGFKLSQTASVFTGLAYMLFPRAAGFLTEGHYGPFTFFTWLPFLVLSAVKLVKTPKFVWSILFAVSLAGLFYSFPTMFAVATLLSFGVLCAIGTFRLIRLRSFQTLFFLAAGIFITFGLTAIALLPQIEWLPNTARHLLLNNPDVYPKWNSKIEFVKALYPQVFGGGQFANTLDNEKWIATGIFVSLLAFVGFVQIGRKLKLAIALILVVVTFVALNNASPVYSLLLTNEWYVLSRVSTRAWFVVVVIAVFLAGFGFEKLVKQKVRLSFLLASLAIGELLLLSWLRFQTPVPEAKTSATKAVLEFVKTDPGQFRVFCVSRCFSQSDVAKHNLETIEGYGTIYQKNYYDQFIQLSQVFWDRYTNLLPPFEIYKFREIQPYSPEIADYNVKYVISPHTLKDKNFELVKKVDDFLVYKNTIAKTRAYFSNGSQAEILEYSPNYIKVDTSSKATSELIIAEVYSPGWKAKDNEGKEVPILETRNKLRKMDLGEKTQFIEMYYYPRSYQLGKTITLVTLFISVALLLRRKQSPH